MTFELTKMTKSRKNNPCLVSHAGYVVILFLSGHIVRIHDVTVDSDLLVSQVTQKPTPPLGLYTMHVCHKQHSYSPTPPRGVGGWVGDRNRTWFGVHAIPIGILKMGHVDQRIDPGH